LVVFTLPMFMIINNILLVVFIFVSLIDGNFKSKVQGFKENFKIFIPVFLFFILAFIATLNTPYELNLSFLEKYWSFILMPLTAIGQRDFYNNYKDVFFRGLMYGCLATLLICYGNTIYELISYKEPLSYFFRWRHLSHEFVAIADTHPAYLGLFIVVSTFYLLLHDKQVNQNHKTVILVFLALGMFQLASRTAIVLYVIVWGVFMIKKVTLSKRVLVLLVPLALIIILFFSFGSDYLKNRLFAIDSIEKDYRFERLSISYQLFLDYPISGLGFEEIKKKRREQYIDNGYIVAAHKNYNAHNQLFEYLNLNGIVGGVLYLLIFCFLIYKTAKEKNELFLFLFVSFFIANLTESMMVRIKGIEYFSLFACLYLSKFITRQQLREN
jgi:O-antigen ligase